MILRLLKSFLGRFKKPLQLGSPAANKLVIAQIMEQGDDGTQERHVRHFAYPHDASSTGMHAAVDLFSDAGLGASDTQFRGGVMGEHEAAPADAEFDQLTDTLRIEFAAIGWDYDGWECAVLKS